MNTIRYINGWNEPTTINREEHHIDQEPLLTAFNTTEDDGVTDKVQIPLSRVVSIKEGTQ